MTNALKLEFHKFFRNRKNWMYLLLVLLVVIGSFCINHLQSKEFLEASSEQYFARKSRAEVEWQSVLFMLGRDVNMTPERRIQLKEAAAFYNYERNKSLMISVGYVSDLVKERRGVLISKNDIYNHLMNQTTDPKIQEEILEKRLLTLDEVKQDIYYNNYLLESELEIQLNPYETNGVNALVLFFKGTTLMLIALLIVLLTVDVYFSEMEEGSYKTYYTQPIKRIHIIVSKFIVMMSCVIGLFILYSGLLYILGNIVGGSGQWDYPIISRENIFTFSIANKLLAPAVVTSISYILRSMALFITGIYFVVALTFLISVFTDSSHKTIGMMTLLFVMTFIFNSLMGMDFTGHMFFPTSYLYPENVLQVKTLTNFSLGIILNAGLGSILLLISFIRFKNKDFLGAKM